MRPLALLLLLLLLAALPARAADPAADRAGEFDYYLLALSWTPTWCRAEGDARNDARCAEGAGMGWGLHGLWPQHERGWPEYCHTRHRDPNRAETAALAEAMGSSGLAWHQWRKHGRCTGLSAADYYELSLRALGRVRLPEVFGRLNRDIRLPASVVEEAFLEANPQLGPGMITVTCRSGAIHEVRVCLTRDLEPRACGADVARDCTLPAAGMDAPR